LKNNINIVFGSRP